MQNESGLWVTGKRILVRMSKVQEESKGGIVLATATLDAEERAQTRGVLIAGGNEAWKCPELLGIKEGMTVLFARYAGDNVKHSKDGVTYRVMNASDVIGYLEAEPDSQFQAALPTMAVYGA